MAEIQKYNLNEELEEANKKYAGSPALVGSSGMTFFGYNNSTRTNMLTSHMNQFLNIMTPEVPFVFTGMERTAGRHSSGYKKTHGKIKVFRKVYKFENLVEHPYFYQMFYWDYDKQQYDVYERRCVHDLGQDFGYPMNNERIDALVEGTEVKGDEVLSKSNSYDKTMNYRFGTNMIVGYTFDPTEYEDAATISYSAAKANMSLVSAKKKFGWNNNDIPINIYGDDEEYRPLPWIGEEVSGVIAASKPLINQQVFNDFKHENLTEVDDSCRSIYINGTGTVVDYEILLNNPDMPKDSFTAQLWQLIDSQNRYWKKIQDTCIEIAKSGKKYSHDIDLLYSKSLKFLERRPDYKWHNGISVFGNVEIRIHVVETPELSYGGKFTFRYGNKSVVARVLPDYMMPFTADGTHMQVLLAVPAVPNRTTGFVPHEMCLTWLARHARAEMAKMETRKEKEKILWDLIKRMNVKQYEKMYATYKALSPKEKDAYLQSAIDNGIYFHQDMIQEDESVFFKLKRATEELPYAKKDTLYVYRFGHIFRLYQQYMLGSMYMFPLKQTDKRGFSVRSTGAINLKGLPERSYKNKRAEAPFSDTAIRFGEYEALTMLIGMEPEELVAAQACFRTSPEASEELTKAQFDEKCKGAFKRVYKSRPAEINNVYMRHLGLNPTFINTDSEIKVLNSRALRPFTLNRKSYICTELQFNEMKLRDRIRDEIMHENPVIDANELNKLLEERLRDTPVISRMYDGRTIFGDEVLAEPELSSTWTYRNQVEVQQKE